MIDCHVHSNFSTDGEMTPEEACEKAISIGLQGITFTDHLDYDYPGADSFDNIDFPSYSEYMDSLVERYKSKLMVKKGIEVGIQPHVVEESLKVVRSIEFDYVLASVHIIDGIDPYYREYYIGKSIKEAYELYLKKILFSMDNFPDYDNIGHMDYIIRYAGYDDRSLRYCDHKELFDEILKILVSKGKGFEINTGSFRDVKGMNTARFDIDILKRYRELGGEIISIGSDAHSLEYIGYKHEYIKEILLETGYRHIVHFENRKPVFTRLL